jgi:hypothetical protein
LFEELENKFSFVETSEKKFSFAKASEKKPGTTAGMVTVMFDQDKGRIIVAVAPGYNLGYTYRVLVPAISNRLAGISSVEQNRFCS